jgi:hypothetical protein
MSRVKARAGTHGIRGTRARTTLDTERIGDTRRGRPVAET